MTAEQHNAGELPVSEQLRLAADGFAYMVGQLLDKGVHPETIETALLSFCVNMLQVQNAENQARAREWLQSIIDLLDKQERVH